MNQGSDEENRKLKAGKLDYSLLPAVFMEGATRVLEHGADKYKRRGYLENEGYDIQGWRALLRHVVAIQSGEGIDPEFGLHHLHHIAANVAMIVHYWELHGVSPRWPVPEDDT